MKTVNTKLVGQLMIRPYRATDFKEVKQLVDKWYVSLFQDTHYAKFVAVKQGRIVGVAVMSMTLTTANLDFLFVHEQWRSQGIGTQLVRKVAFWAKSKRAEGLGVNSGIENKKAHAFYKNEGFKQVGKVYNFFSNSNWQLFFWKKV
ncbi:GNAT family N-acetyltransferase [Candidatus Woesearchaeota archaeon]|nr:GNAT family N-acetyltransferase [Candidatus Woesearchaeota archaeon]